MENFVFQSRNLWCRAFAQSGSEDSRVSDAFSYTQAPTGLDVVCDDKETKKLSPWGSCNPCHGIEPKINRRLGRSEVCA